MTPATALVLAATEKKSAEVTDWGERILWTGICLAFVLVVYLLMWRAWKRRGRKQAGIPELAEIPDDPGTPQLPPLTGRYFGTTQAGDWLERVVARGLGTRSAAELTLTDRGLVVERPGAAGFFVPAADLRGARADRAIAGKVMPEGGLLVVTWAHGDQTYDSGFRSHHVADHDEWIAAITARSAAPSGSNATTNHQEGTVQ